METKDLKNDDELEAAKARGWQLIELMKQGKATPEESRELTWLLVAIERYEDRYYETKLLYRIITRAWKRGEEI
ncbi:MAG: hypothetical protein H3C54_00555 [Taibaiella sp.]|nr:hypothetical protein [Taibaiella sp.]